jgi:hypothetical protein
MPHTESALKNFFHLYEQNSHSGEIAAIVSQFADVFFAASPQGAQAVRISDLASAVQKRKQLFDSLGCQSTSLVSLDPVALDARYTLARTRWRMIFSRRPGNAEEILADSSFIVDTNGSELKIVFYLAHQDIMAVLKERGIAH